ncbi:MAG: class I SAM-dependent methyltransferase [Deltaproteobacteria bacterium]|nr:class I SAM-dependent methyltransferase [Deltaproteobacteria bacterium]
MDSTNSKGNHHPRIFSDLAYLWPLLSPFEDYLPEAESVHRVLAEHLDPVLYRGGAKPCLLEMGAGGGHTLYHLANRYDLTAVDRSEMMLENLRRLNPNVATHLGDMMSIRLGRTFDAVLIHDAIDYLQDEKEVTKALATAFTHLGPGGIVLVAPTYVTETFIDHDVAHDHHSDGETDLTYFSYVHRPRPDDTKVETILLYLVRKDGRVETVEDRHACGLFSTDAWLAMMAAVGFDVETDYLIGPEQDGDDGVPMFVGKRSDNKIRLDKKNTGHL